jgi:hypothetical protein
MLQTKQVEKPVMTQDQILGYVNGFEDMHDLCLVQVGIFCGLAQASSWDRTGSLGPVKHLALQGCL